MERIERGLMSDRIASRSRGDADLLGGGRRTSAARWRRTF